MRVFAFVLLFFSLGACGKKNQSSDDGGAPDLSRPSDGGTQDDLATLDLSVPDAGSGDMTGGGPDLDNHVALKLATPAVPLKQDGGVDYYEMHVKEGTAQILPGNKTTVWGFEGAYPGPTIQATMGRPVTLKVFNDLPVTESLSIHNHGHNVASIYDGHPSENTIPKGGSYEYKYPNKQQGGTGPNYRGAGTYWFHDHIANLTAPHVYKGIAAFYILNPAPGSTEAALNLPSGAHDIPLLIQDRSFNADNSFKYDVSFITGFAGDTLVVNGTAHPYLNVSRRKYRFRMLNGANARRFNVGLSAGSMFQIGADGGLLPTQLNPSKIPLGPAERADIVIDFSKYKVGDVVTLTNDDPGQPALPEILQFRVTKDEADTSSLPVTLDSSFVRYTESVPTVTRTRSLTFFYDGGSGEWQMNGKTYNASAYEFGAEADAGLHTKLGDVEIWSLINSDAGHPVPHPFHQHLVDFQILDICPVNNPTCGMAPIGGQSAWKDTVLVPASSIVRIKMPFYFNGPEAASSVFPGAYVFHCHTLEHEDHAMMLQQLIQP